MKPQLLKLTKSAVHSYSIRKELQPNINNKWHFHTELELIQFHKGSGLQFIGDHISRFQKGDTLLIGSNLPHYWKFDEIDDQNAASDSAYSTVIHFSENFWGNIFLDLPELKEVKQVIEKAKKGLLIQSHENNHLINLIERLYNANKIFKITTLIECIQAFADDQNTKTLSSEGFLNSFSLIENDRINTIYNFTLSNYNKKISLEEIATIVNLEPNSFCRFFKLRTGKTYSNFLQEIRIGQACKFLIENKQNLKNICFASGFNNFSCFHKGFKSITGKTPKEYRDIHLKN